MKKEIFLVGITFMLLALAGCAIASAHIYGDTWSITKTTQLANSTAWEGSSIWCDDGTRLFYASNESGNFDVWMMDADGTNKIQIANESADEFPLFCWYDNLIYVSKQFGSSNLWVVNNLWSINASDVEMIALTNDNYWNADPALIYVPVPLIYDMQPTDTIDNNVPLIRANFSCSFGNVSKVNILVDAVNVTQNATITDSHVSYIPTTPLDCGTHNFTVRVESDRYTYGYGFQFFTITYITNITPIGGVYTNTPTISANISCGYGDISLVTISVDEVDVTPNATITPSYVSYTPITPLANGTHNVTVYVESTKGINDSKSWTFVVNPEYPPPRPRGGGGAAPPYAPKIIFASNRSGNFDIWMINPNGIGLQQLTFDPSNEYSPVGIGSKIVYVSDKEGNKDIWIMNNDGSNKVQLTTEPSNEYAPVIIHSKIFYISDQSGNEDIWSMCEDGSNKERLTFSTVDESMPSWSPIGGIIYAARTGVNDDYDLWMMNTNGTGKTQLTNSTVNETKPVFSPSPYRLGVAYVTEQDDDANIWITDFTESGDKVRIWSLEEGYTLVCRWADDNGSLLSLCRNGTFVDHEYVPVGCTFSLPRTYGSPTITGTVNGISTFENNIFEVEVVDVTQYSDTGEVLFSNATRILTNALIPLKIGTPVFDTDSPSNPYPSIFGTHNGTITPDQTITVSKLYTYPCAGTGGHTESIELYEKGALIANGTWNGYQGDWHNITIHNVSGAPYVTLLEDHEYNYTVKTGSYPQIIHARSKEAIAGAGTITCDKFIDANGKVYDDWIPAIKLH